MRRARSPMSSRPLAAACGSPPLRARPTPRCSRRCWRHVHGGRAKGHRGGARPAGPDGGRSGAGHVAGGDDPEAHRRDPAVRVRAPRRHPRAVRSDGGAESCRCRSTMRPARCRTCARRPMPALPTRWTASTRFWRASRRSTPRSSRARASAPTSPTISTSATACSPSISEEVGIRTVTRVQR